VNSQLTKSVVTCKATKRFCSTPRSATVISHGRALSWAKLEVENIQADDGVSPRLAHKDHQWSVRVCDQVSSVWCNCDGNQLLSGYMRDLSESATKRGVGQARRSALAIVERGQTIDKLTFVGIGHQAPYAR
jgi:hypothetical protein